MGSSPRVSHPPSQAELRFDLTGATARAEAARCELALADGAAAAASDARLVLTVRLVAALAEIDPERAVEHARTARRMADELGTNRADAYALVARGLTDHSPDSVGIRVSAARRILAAAHTDSPELATVGHFLLLTSLLEQGSIRTLDVEMSPYGESFARFPALENSRHVAWFRCLRAILDGRTRDAEELADQILASAPADHAGAARTVWAAQVGTIRWMQGRIHEMEPAFLTARQEQPHNQLWQLSLAWLWHLQGRDSAARAFFDAFEGLESIPRDRNYIVTLTILGELAARLGTDAQARSVRDALLPAASHVVPVGLGLAWWGTAARTLAMLSLRLDRADDARSLLRTAIDLCARSGAQAWLVESQLELADLELGEQGDLIVAADLAEQAQTTARALGFPALLQRAESVLSRLPRREAPQPPPYPLLAPEEARAEVRVLGTFEVISHDGVRATWTSRKSRELLKMLIARRGVPTAREWFMHQLWPDTAPKTLANRFSVALSTVRRALDPRRIFPSDRHIVSIDDAVHVNLGALRVDVEEFLDAAASADPGAWQHAVRLYAGDPFAEEPYADWAQPLRAHAQTAFRAAASALAESAEILDPLAASELYRRILEIEPSDQSARDGLTRALAALGVGPGVAYAMRSAST